MSTEKIGKSEGNVTLTAGEATALSFIACYRKTSPKRCRRVLNLLSGTAREIGKGIMARKK